MDAHGKDSDMPEHQPGTTHASRLWLACSRDDAALREREQAQEEDEVRRRRLQRHTRNLVFVAAALSVAAAAILTWLGAAA